MEDFEPPLSQPLAPCKVVRLQCFLSGFWTLLAEQFSLFQGPPMLQRKGPVAITSHLLGFPPPLSRRPKGFLFLPGPECSQSALIPGVQLGFLIDVSLCLLLRCLCTPQPLPARPPISCSYGSCNNSQPTGSSSFPLGFSASKWGRGTEGECQRHHRKVSSHSPCWLSSQAQGILWHSGRTCSIIDIYV